MILPGVLNVVVLFWCCASTAFAIASNSLRLHEAHTQLSAAVAEDAHSHLSAVHVQPGNFYAALKARCDANGKIAADGTTTIPSFPTDGGCGGNTPFSELYQLLGLQYLDERLHYYVKGESKPVVDPFKSEAEDDPNQLATFALISALDESPRLWRLFFSTKNCVEKIQFVVAFEKPTDSSRPWKLASFSDSTITSKTNVYYRAIDAYTKSKENGCPAHMTAGFFHEMFYYICQNGGTRVDLMAAKWGATGSYVWPRIGFEGMAEIESGTATAVKLTEKPITPAKEKALKWLKSACKYDDNLEKCTASFSMHSMFDPEAAPFKNEPATHTAIKEAWKDRSDKQGVQAHFMLQPGKCTTPDPKGEAGVSWRLLTQAKEDSAASLKALVDSKA